jgi:spectinomycin phosphotransferase
MLEKPDIHEDRIKVVLLDEYRLQALEIVFLPIGADVNTAVYRVDGADEQIYFFKLRKSAFDELSTSVPQLLHKQGLRQIIAPVKTRAGQLWGSLDEYKTILYPYIEGQDGYEAALSDRQWLDLGAALQRLHAARVPAALARLIPQEAYSAEGRDRVKVFQAQAAAIDFLEPVAARLAEFMRQKRAVIDDLVGQAQELGELLQKRHQEFVLCHGDFHPGNVLIGTDGNLYLVDWDNLIFAPKERDLMAVGAGMGGLWSEARLKDLFYQGYGRVEINRMALAYYRSERIVQDIAAFCEQLFLTEEGGEDREQAYRYFTGQFLPGREIEAALKNRGDPQVWT